MPRRPSPIRRRVQTFIKRLSGGSFHASDNGVDEEENPFADPVNPFTDPPTITELVEAELVVFTHIVTDLYNRPHHTTVPDLTAELDLRLDLLKRGGKSKDRIAKMLRKEMVGSGLRARIDVQRHRFKDANDHDLVLRLETVGFL
ncbi:uncharacterized protein LAJ45_04834 [Morchella importuna]|uniref:uncharacterized protein n=1 Tax=Morchella importuna TaxID=1174673 RepID=UPI001E8CBEE9|nr:uncharacterized protein LAJ45_04834 [Morchella importuna]KAH8151132.1 hypothetical protein LAJ45_04834 [Morchella importuna]